MKYNYKKVIAGSLALVIAGGAAIGGSLIGNIDNKNTITVEAAVDSNNDDWLTTKGDLIVDRNGNEVRLTGVNWFGFNCSENVFHGAWSFGTVDADGNGHADAGVHDQLMSIADHGFNLLRIPISSELLVSWMEGSPHAVGSIAIAEPDGFNGVGCNAEFAVPGTSDSPKSSMEIFDIIMGWCKELGIKVMIDIHSPDENNSGHNYELWYGKAGISSQLWEDSLVWLADKYSNDDTILAYDLKNEPHGKAADTLTGKGAKWDGSTDENNWKYAAEKCGNAIMEVNPNALIMVEGIEIYPKEGQDWSSPAGGYGAPENYYGAWWGGNLRGVRDHPIKITGANGNSQLVYSPHDYGPTVYSQTWFHMAPESPNADGEYDAKEGVFDVDSLLDEYWYNSWAYIDEEGIAPLLIGEWGLKTVSEGGTLADQKWGEILRDYMTEKHINATFWCYNPDSGDTGGLVDNDWSTWVTGKYNLVEPSLWQDENGTFIGLDHQVALGVNGQSLDEYYGNSSGGATTTKATTTKTTTTTAKTTSATKTTTTTAKTTSATTTSAPPKNIVYGDIDLDGKSSQITDVILLSKHIAKKLQLPAGSQYLANANVNLKGSSAETVDTADLKAVIDVLLGAVDSLPVS
jgi:aryl-phospho-beta-D-glucosidase BglC (GH1 family)